MKKCEDYTGMMARYYVPARGYGRGDTLEGTGAVPGGGGRAARTRHPPHGTANWSEDRL